jgi:cytochrome b6-f complex iron-sulfur subunit
MSLSRRALLARLPLGLTLGRLLTACADPEQTGDPLDGWVAVSLADHPQLLTVGGSAQITRPADLIDVHLIHAQQGRYIAAWRICTHGACYLDWDAPGAQLVCPCHGSTFALDGSPTHGPATIPLRVLRTTQRGDLLYIEPPG